MANIVNLYVLYRIVKDLSTPFNETEAFKLGLIDEQILEMKYNIITELGELIKAAFMLVIAILLVIFLV